MTTDGLAGWWRRVFTGDRPNVKSGHRWLFWGWRRCELVIKSMVSRLFPLHWRLRNSGISIRIKSSADWIIYNDIFVDAEYDEPIRQTLLNRPADRPLFILDLGANMGFFAKRVLHVAAELGVPHDALTIVCVEGSPSVFRRLGARMKEDGEWADVATLVNGLVGSKRSGHGKIRQRLFHGMNNTLDDAAWGGSTVPYVDLESICGDIACIDLLKCDIEGDEQAVFEGYGELLQRVDRLVFELHEEACDRDTCHRMLSDAGLDGYRPLWDIPGRPLEYFWREHGASCARPGKVTATA